MKIFFYLIPFYALVFFTLNDIKAQTTYVPDDNFEQALIDLGYDTVLDDYVLTANVSGITHLNVFGEGISDLTGIEAFVSLVQLTLGSNNLTSLDLSNNTNLLQLAITNNDLTNLDLTNNTSLFHVNFSGNDFVNLDLSYLPNLTQIYGTNLPLLESLNVKNGNNTSVTHFNVHTTPSLNCIQVDDGAYSTANWTLVDSHVVFDETCALIYVPDDNFEQALIDLGYDTVLDDHVYESNVSGITHLNVFGEGISDLTGIEAFVSLVQLTLGSNNLTSLDLSNNTNLLQLAITNNDLTNLDLTNNTSLFHVNFSGNDFVNLDLSYLPNLTQIFGTNLPLLESLNVKNGNNTSVTHFNVHTTPSLNCIQVDDGAYSTTNWTLVDSHVVFDETCALVYVPDNNFEQALIDLGYDTVLDDHVYESNVSGITHLNVFGEGISDLTGIEAFVSLVQLTLGSNNLTSLDLSNNTNLLQLAITNNDLTNLDLTNNTSLFHVNFSGNDFVNLDLSYLPNLTQIYGTNLPLLESLNVKNGNNTSVTHFNVHTTPSLNCIQVDDGAYSTANWTLVDSHVVFDETCALIYVPDDNFEQALIDLGYDTVLDDHVYESNVSGITHLNVFGEGISDLTGIEAFVSLVQLTLGSNNLTSLDLSNNTNLLQLAITNNDLTNLDLTNNTSLFHVNFSGNDFVNLDLSYLPNLTQIFGTNLPLLESLNVKNGNNTSVTHFNVHTTPSLNCIQVDDGAYSTTNWTLVDSHVVFDETCALVYVPDNNFEQALIDLGYDTVLDDYVYESNVSGITHLNVFGEGISDLTGIEAFVSLVQLTLGSNNLTSLDLSNNTNLLQLAFSNNNLTSIDLTNNTSLYHVNFSGNDFVNLDLSYLPNLTQIFGTNLPLLESLNVKNGNNTSVTHFNVHTTPSLNCIQVDDGAYSTTNWTLVDSHVVFDETCALVYVPDNNFEQALIDLGYDTVLDDYVYESNVSGITHLNVFGEGISDLTGIEAFVSLVQLTLGSNNLTSLDLSNNTNLLQLAFSNNNLTSIDLTNNTSLYHVNFSRNDFVNLDLSYLPNLTQIFGTNLPYLETLDVQNGNNTSVTHFLVHTNPSLYCIQVDDGAYSTANWMNVDPHVSFDESCPPVALCNDFSVNLKASGDASITVSDIDAGSYAISGIAGMTLNLSYFDCADVGSNTVILTVTDLNGETSTCSATVTVIDNIPPVALCQNVTVHLDGSGNGSTTATAIDNGSSDICGIQSMVLSQTDFDCSHVGSNTVTMTVTDNSGNTSSCTGTVTVVDNIAPVALCQNVTVHLDGSGSGSTTATAVNNGSSDNCSIQSLVLSQTDFDCSHIGGNAVTLTVTDNSGNASSCTGTVTVVDNLSPVALCQNVSVQLDGSGSGSTTATAVNNGSSDNCGIQSMVLSQTDFDCSHVGGNAVTLTVTDINGNTSSCTGTVTVVDNIAPVALCQNVSVQLDGSGNGSTTATAVDNGSSDNCGIQSMVLSQTDFDCSHVGSNAVTLTVTDNSGNTSSCTGTVTVVDNIAPVALCQNVSVQLDGSGSGSTTATAVDNGSSDNCGIQSIVLSQTDFDCSHVGSNTVTLMVTDNSGNTSSCTETVTVVDNIAPVALCQNVSVQLDGSGSGSTTATAVNNGSSDNCSIQSMVLSQTGFDCSHVGSNAVALTVTDNSGNASSCTGTVTVVDNLSPVALCQNVIVQLDGSGSGSTTATAVDNGSSDNCGIQSMVLSQTDFDCSHVGGNAVTLTVTDNSGNSSSCTGTVTVVDNIAPVALCQNVSVQLDGSGSGSTTATAVNNGSSDNCGIQSMVLSQTDFDCSHVGSNAVTLTVTDNSGNASSCTGTVTVVDNLSPVALCQNVIVQLDGSGSGSTTATAVDNGSSDNCGIQSIVLSQTDFDCSHVGSNTVTLMVTDNSGNTSSCTETVTVVDNIAPVALCQNVSVQLDGSGSGSTTATAVNNGSSDNCSIQSMVLSQTGFDCSHVGSNAVTLTVTDNSGNASSCTGTVTVVDNLSPVALCQNVIVQLDGSGSGSTTATAVNNGSSDNCGIQSMVLSQTDFDCSHIGSNAVTLTVTDNSGNTSSCSGTVTVVDNIAPVALCQNVSVQLDGSGSGSTTATAVDNGSSDNCGIQSMVLSQTDFDCSHVGSNTVTLMVTDNSGNTSSCSGTVTVVDNIAPVALCQNVSVQLDGSGSGSTTATAVNNGSSDNCGIQSMVLSQTGFDCSHVGSNAVTLTVTDNSGNTSSCTGTVTVVDNLSPVALCQNVSVHLDGSGSGSTTATAVDNGSSDNCGVQSIALSQTDFDCFDVGANVVTLTVTDNYGNISSCNATVSVEDNIAPIAACNDITIELDPTGNASIVPSQIDAGSFDNCYIDLMTVSQEQFDCSHANTTSMVQLEVFDQSGNSATCQSFVTVVKGEGLPSGWDNTDIGTANGNATFDPCDELFTISSYGKSLPFSDKQHYAFRELCGDGEIIAHVVSVTSPGWAGIQMRENEDVGSKKVALKTKLSNIVRREYRSVTNGNTKGKQFPRPQATWLKLVRSGNNFQGFSSVNGSAWQFAFSINVSMNSCIQIGLFSESYNNNAQTVAQFDNVTIIGDGEGMDFAVPEIGILEQPVLVDKNFGIYPNPTSGDFTIDLTAYQQQKISLEVFNNLGQRVFVKDFEKVENSMQSFDLSHLKEGLYWVSIQQDDMFKTKKLSIIR